MKTYYLLRIASWLSRYVPSRTGYWLCAFFGGIIFYLKPSIRQAVMDNMRHVLPNSSERQRRTIARRVIRNNFKNYYDLVRLPHLKAEDVERMVATVYGMEHWRNAFAQGRGVIIMSGHIGNFSLVVQLAAIRGFPVAIVGEDIKPPKLYDYVNYLRSSFGLKFIRSGSSEVRTIYKWLRSGGGLGLAVDRDYMNGGVPVQLFDAPADILPGPVVLALRLKTPLIPVHTVRLRDNSSIVTIYPPMELERTGDNERDVQVGLRKVAVFLEEIIRKAPDQWIILQRVWDRPQATDPQPEPQPEPPNPNGKTDETHVLSVSAETNESV